MNNKAHNRAEGPGH